MGEDLRSGPGGESEISPMVLIRPLPERRQAARETGSGSAIQPEGMQRETRSGFPLPRCALGPQG